LDSGTPQQPQQQGAKPNWTAIFIVAALVGICFVGTIGAALGYSGIAVGVLGTAGSIALLVKGTAKLKRPAIGGVIAGVVIAVSGFLGGESRRQQAAAKAEAEAATQKTADLAKSEREDAASKVSALPASASTEEVVAACQKADSLSAIPANKAQQCGDAFLEAAKALIASRKVSEAMPLLRRAVELTSRKEEASKALASATALLDGDDAEKLLGQADEKLKAGDLKGANEALNAAQQKVRAVQNSSGEQDAVELTTKLTAHSKLTQAALDKVVATQKAQAAADEKARLGKRKFVNLSPDGFAAALVRANDQGDLNEVMETKFKGKYFRWQAKFLQKGMMSGFYANAGHALEIECDMDAQAVSRSLDELPKWQAITIEGRLRIGFATFADGMTPGRKRVQFDECIVR